MSDQCRWGFLSTAFIGRKNWQAIRWAENARLMAVASRNKTRSQEFIDACQSFVPMDLVPQAFGSYEELLASDSIDAVYIPLPTGLRKQWVIRAAEAGKHVLCEKPCSTSAPELKEMIEACESNNVQFMDGVMYMHTQRLAELRKTLDQSDAIGDIRRIATQFSFCADDEFKSGNIRTDSRLEPHGCLGDLGWYTIRFILWVMDFQMPTKVRGTMLRSFQRDGSPAPVPMEFAGEVFFETGQSASFYNSFMTDHQQWASVSGTRGHVYIPDFVLPYFGNQLKFQVTNAQFNTYGCDFNMEDYSRITSTSEYSGGAASSAETNLFRNFSQLALSGKLDSYWPEISHKTQAVLDACFDSACNDSVLTIVTQL